MRYNFIIFMISFLVTTCKSCPETYTYKLPKQMNDGLAIASLSEADLDTAVISKAIDQIECGKFNSIHSILIFKDNALVLEKYFQGFDYANEKVIRSLACKQLVWSRLIEKNAGCH